VGDIWEKASDAVQSDQSDHMDDDDDDAVDDDEVKDELMESLRRSEEAIFEEVRVKQEATRGRGRGRPKKEKVFIPDATMDA